MVQAAALIVAGLTLPMFMGIVVQPLITAVERLAEVEMGPGGWIERFGRSIARAFAAKWGGLSSWASLMPPAGFVLGLWVLIRPPAVALRLFGRLPP
ncbi:MAG: hypothetical protein KIT68_01870 [Phycisphaeraceae bacterium]|nr:hypothetical protein [Phycisphaeraceae bacterium]